MISKQTEQTIEVMQNFGFTPPEIEIYVAVLTLEKATVSKIARLTKRGRTAIYFHVKRLIERGVLKETRHKNKLSLIATRPDELAKLFDRWSTDFRSLVPDLESLKKISGETPTIQISDSKGGYYKVYEELASLPEKGMFRVLEGSMAVKHEIDLLTNEEWKKFFQRLVDRNIVTKGIFTEESTKVVDKKLDKDLRAIARKRVWHVRLISESNLPFKDMLFIYGNKVAFMFPQTSLVLTVTHSGIAQALTVMFDSLYMLGRPGEIV